MRKWNISTLDKEAAQQVAFYFADEDVRAEIKRILNILSTHDDPRKPSSGLIVGPIEHDAPGWFRVKVPRYALHIIFRLLVVRGDMVTEVPTDQLPSESEERYIDITRIGRHPDVYGKALREQYRKLTDKK